MANLGIFYSCFLWLCLLCSAFAESHIDSQHTYTVQLSSLKPSSVCTPSSKAPNSHKSSSSSSSLKVVHRHGPCSDLPQDRRVRSAEDIAGEILRQDKSRAEAIRSRMAGGARFEEEAVTLPARSGAELGFGNYYVTVGLGTPKKDVSLAFDTGSDLTWTQCQPCAGHCYRQKDPIFDPSDSSSYANQSCSSQACSNLQSSSGGECPDPSGTCIYHVEYGDKSITEGYLATETLTLTSSDVIDNFLFGCGQNNGGLFAGVAGLLGLGRDSISIVEQGAAKYNRLFSYCLPATSSSTGHLTLGEARPAQQYTPMLTLSPGGSFYALKVSGIAIAGRQLAAEASAALQSARSIIDSGTVITRLPEPAYRALSEEFRKYMSEYPQASEGAGGGLLDTCFDVGGSGNGTLTIPKVSIVYGGGATVDLEAENIVYRTAATTVCLAFAASNGLALVGNVQQRGFEVVYDLAGSRIGFTPGGC